MFCMFIYFLIFENGYSVSVCASWQEGLLPTQLNCTGRQAMQKLCIYGVGHAERKLHRAESGIGEASGAAPVEPPKVACHSTRLHFVVSKFDT